MISTCNAASRRAVLFGLLLSLLPAWTFALGTDNTGALKQHSALSFEAQLPDSQDIAPIDGRLVLFVSYGADKQRHLECSGHYLLGKS